MATSIIKRQSEIVKTKTVTVTTDANGRFNPVEAVGSTLTNLLVIKAASDDWYHFRFYSSTSGGTSRVIVTNYSNDTTVLNLTLTVVITYI